MMLPFLLALLTFAALLPVLLPLLRGAQPAPDRASHDQAVYRDQLRELDRDIERGVLTETEAATVRLEIQRRLLAVPADHTQSPPARAPFLASLTGIVAAGGALAVYLVLSVPAAQTTPGLTPEAATALTRLAERLRANPDDAEAWSLHARAMTRLSRWDEAETAWRKVITLGHASPSAVAALGEILTMRESGTVGQEARGLFAMALQGDPRHDMARYYLALAAAQSGDAKGAIAQWQALLDGMSPGAPGRQDVTRQIAETARAAGVPVPPPNERLAMIEGMVGTLADRLRQNPDDAEGWTRLGQSYAVLRRADAAADAYEKAAALKPADPTLKRAAAEALLAGLKPEDPMPPRALALLRQVETALPTDPTVLWYLGLTAARERRPAQAREYWTRLSQVLPPDGEDAKMVRAALGALGSGP